MSQPKVFEFAKEVGIETLALMDKIRKWDLPVKSHMAELSPDVIEQIRAKLEEESSAGKKKKAKKKTAKKKATTKKATAKKATKKKAVTKKATTKKATAKKATAKKTVIRRKAGAEEKPEALSLEQKLEAEVAAKMATKDVEAPAESMPVVDVEVKPKEASDKAAASSTLKREIKMTDNGPVSGVKSERPRRNIIGKMDLTKVSPKPQSQKQQKTSTRNLRTGFVAQAPMEMPKDDDSFGGRKDRDQRKKKVAGPVPAPSSKDKEQAPPTFVSSDFKKREVVFQPKKKRVVVSGDFKKTQLTTPAAHKRVVKVYGSMKVSELAQNLGVKAPVLIKSLIKNGLTGNINTELDFDTISLIVPEFNYEAENVQKSDSELVEQAAFGDLDAEKVPRSPVVTVMGHVDHGKTTLLDNIRKAKVADGEAGGITQHIGAYRVKTSIGEITFIDTPGHAAFTAMRSRGAHSTDIVILVVAADDGVMPQTIEAISHSKAADVPMIVAVNKMDKADANPDKVKQQLAEHEVVSEEWGGTTIFCPVSALKGDGVSELLEQVSLLAEIQELKANPKRSAMGIVIESRVEKGRGNVATLLVQDGTLKAGQSMVVGEVAARARQIFDENGKVLKEAGPSRPVEVIGLPEAPQAGDTFEACKDEKAAARIADARREKKMKEQAAESAAPITMEDLFSKVKMGDLKELPIVLKSDVAGSGEAIRGMFDKLSTEEVKIKIIHSAVGGISESDILLASTAGGLVVGF